MNPYPQPQYPAPPAYTDIVQSPIIIPVYPQGFTYSLPVPQSNSESNTIQPSIPYSNIIQQSIPYSLPIPQSNIGTTQYPVFNPYSVPIQRALDSIPGYSSVNTLDSVASSIQRVPMHHQRIKVVFLSFFCITLLAVGFVLFFVLFQR